MKNLLGFLCSKSAMHLIFFAAFAGLGVAQKLAITIDDLP